MPRIELINITKRWGDFYGVKNLNMVIEDRDFVSLLGPSGCGKTTTLRMIAGLETPTEGTIKIGDKVVFDSKTGINLAPDKRDIGFIFQNYALWPHMTVFENIAFGLENMKWNKKDIKARVKEMLKLMKMRFPYADELYITTLIKGYLRLETSIFPVAYDTSGERKRQLLAAPKISTRYIETNVPTRISNASLTAIPTQV